MKLACFTRLAASSALFAALCLPAGAQQPQPTRSGAAVSFASVVEAIEFKAVAADKQALVLERIGIRVGDRLTAEARHQIGRQLAGVQAGMTFSYKAGVKPGTVKLIINGDC